MLPEEEWVDESASFIPSTTAHIIIKRSAKFDFLFKILIETLTYYVRLLML
jgi:hypothetical protein